MMMRQNDQISLASVNEAHLAMLATQGNEQITQAALTEMVSAQQAMQQVAQTQNIEVPKVNFFPSTHPDPRKARRRDIKQAQNSLNTIIST